MSAERLLCMLSPQSMDPARLLEGSRSTSPARTEAADVRAALEVMRPRTLRTALLLRHLPEMVTPGELQVYSLQLLTELQQRRQRSPRWTRHLLTQAGIVRAAIEEASSPERVCRVCAGEGVIWIRSRGKPDRCETCEACDGSGLRRWNLRRRRKAAGVASESTYLRSCAEPHAWLVRYVEQDQHSGARVLVHTLGW